MRQVSRPLNVAAVIVLTALFGFWTPATADSAPGNAGVSLSRLPLSFEPNVGQAPAEARFMSYAAGQRLWLGAKAALFTAAGADSGTGGIRIRGVGGNANPSVVGENEQPVPESA